MTTEPAPSVGELMTAMVPMTRTLNLEFTETTPTRSVVELPDQEAYRNHVGGPHAGAMFTLGESASGALVLAAFEKHLSGAVPLPVHVGVSYQKLAKGRITATAHLDRDASEVVAELERGVRPEFPVRVTLTREDGAVTGEMTITWTLRPHS